MIAREDRPGDKRLVGYVTGTADPTEIRVQLSERLPPYMVPAVVVAIEALPLTPNGKLDTRALPAPESRDVMVTGPRAARSRRSWPAFTPRFWGSTTSDWMTHSSIWAGIRCWRCACLRRSTPHWTPTFRYPPCSRRPRLPNWRVVSVWVRVGLSRLVAMERPAVVPLSFAQQRLWFIDQLQGPSPVYNMATALRLHGMLDPEALGAALADVAGRHESLRTLLVAPEGIPQQLIVACPSGPTSGGMSLMPVAGRRAAWTRPSARRRVTRFDLASEIPLRATLFRVADDDHVLVAGGAPYRRRWLVDRSV